MNEDVEISLLQDDVTIETPLVSDYILPTATESTLGGVKIGDNINIDNSGHISVPVATESSVGVVKAGTGLSVASDGTLTATGTYDLPEATKTTLGGVYMDDELSTTSTHPVQNAVVSLELQELGDDITTLNGTVGGLSTTVGNLSTTVGNLGTTVTNLSGTVGNQGNDISTIQGNITSLGTRVGNCEGDITNLGNTVSAMGAFVDELSTDVNETIGYSDIANYWTAGNVTIVGKGKIAYVNFDLEGSLTINGGSYENILEITDDELKPKYPMEGFLITDAGILKVSAFTSGIFRAYNLSSSNITLTKLSGNIPIILNEWQTI